MKKIICWLMAMAGFAAFAESFQVPTYHSLSWKVPAASIAAVEAKYVNLYAELDGVRVGSEARAVFGNADIDFTADTILQGDGGWNWANPTNIYGATFGVEFLNAELGVIATSSNSLYEAILQEDVLDIVKTDNYSPSTALTTFTFLGVIVGEDGVYEYLKKVFDGLGAKVVPVADASGNIVDYVISLGNDITGPVSLNANLGKLTIDLKGFAISGTNAWSGVDTEATGGNAIEIKGALATSERGATVLEFISDPATGYAGTVRGGRGADAGTGTAGGYAVYSDVAGVSVTVGGNVSFLGGDSGNSMTNSAVAGRAAVNADKVAATGTVAAGQDGTAYDAWAWAVCTGKTEDAFPDGTFFDGSKIWLYQRTDGSTNDPARAKFDFGAFTILAGLDGVVHFVDKKIYVDRFSVPSAAGDLTFAGEANTVLAASGLGSAFDVMSLASQTRVWTNLAFTCEMPTEGWDGQGAVSFDGGAVHVVGGAFRVADCTFAGLGSTQLGGAVCAEALAADSEIADSSFDGNDACNEKNGSGGAVYATAAAAGVTLRIADCTFEGNRSEDGGAVSSKTVVEGDVPVAIDVVDTLFAGNRATAEGGAVFAEGDLYVNTNAVTAALGETLFTNNFAGVDGGAVALNGSGDPAGALVRMCRGVSFVGNTVSNAVDYAAGGAVFSYTYGERIEALGVAFVGNAVYGQALYGVYGGAVFGDCATNSFDTCVFDGNAAVPLDEGQMFYGGAVEHENGVLALRNCTFRNQNLEAVDAYGSSLSVTNCVLVGNGLAFGDDVLDLNAEESAVSLAYSAWGKVSLDATPAVDEHNLTDRTTAIYAADDSLHLDESAFNAVAALGLPQPGVFDFDEVEYGSRAPGFSMGAFEAGTVPATVNVNGTKTYDGYANSNGCVWVFTSTATDPDFLALGDVSELVTVTNWWFGNKNAGDFSGTSPAPQDIDAAVDGNTDEIRRWIAAGLIEVTYDGTIDPRDVALGGLTFELTPEEYEWTGSEVLANVVLVDTLPEEDETLVADVDYALSYANNVNPTADAVVTADLLRNYAGATNRTYWITAYFVEYRFDGKLEESLTETVGKTSGVEVVKTGLPETLYGYVFDRYYSTTNGAVRRADAEGGLLRLQALYCTDSNDDGVPDKYQRKVLAKVVKGEWTKDADGNTVANGRDTVLWATLWKDGQWDATGTGTVDGGVPTAGSRPDGGYSAGGWLAFDASGNLTKVADPAAWEFTSSKVPFLIYAYSHTAGTTAQASGRGRGGSGRDGTATAPAEKDLLEQYSAQMSVKEATFTGTQLKLKTKLVVSGADTVIDVPVGDTELKLYFTEKLGENWQSQSCVTDEGGVITVDLTDRSGFYKVGL